jgi:hypothetical protein
VRTMGSGQDSPLASTVWVIWMTLMARSFAGLAAPAATVGDRLR